MHVYFFSLKKIKFKLFKSLPNGNSLKNKEIPSNPLDLKKNDLSSIPSYKDTIGYNIEEKIVYKASQHKKRKKFNLIIYIDCYTTFYIDIF